MYLIVTARGHGPGSPLTDPKGLIMFNSLIRRTLVEDGPPGGSRHRRLRGRVRPILALAAALAAGFTMMTVAAPESAQALTNLDGPWTVVHGGTGQLSLNADGTYTSTCQVTPGYGDAWCPAPSGTFDRDALGGSYVTFHGADGSTTSYRYSGSVSSPDTITSVVGSRTFSALVMKKGTKFVCTEWGDNASQLKGSPVAYLDATGTILYATGSHDLIGPATVDNAGSVAETSPNSFRTGSCAAATRLTPASFIHVDALSDATSLTSLTSLEASGTWTPLARVTIKDLAGTTVPRVSVTAFVNGGNAVTCVTTKNGTCTLTGAALANTVDSATFAIYSHGVVKANPRFIQYPADSSLLNVTIYNPLVGPPPPPPTPAPLTVHVVDLDATWFGTGTPGQWKPQATVHVEGSDGYIVYGATVTGTFTGQSGTVTCVTNGSGACSLGDFILPTSTTSTVLTVTDVAAAGYTYLPSSNTDPDGDSNGTTITVTGP
jgi:hypothetical protein